MVVVLSSLRHPPHRAILGYKNCDKCNTEGKQSARVSVFVCVPLPIPLPSADRTKAPSAQMPPDCCMSYSTDGHSPRSTSSCQT